MPPSTADATILRALETASPIIGHNASGAALQRLCPSRKYHRCFWRELNDKYPVTQFRLPPLPHRCGTLKGDAAMRDDACAIPPAERMLVHAGCNCRQAETAMSERRLRGRTGVAYSEGGPHRCDRCQRVGWRCDCSRRDCSRRDGGGRDSCRRDGGRREAVDKSGVEDGGAVGASRRVAQLACGTRQRGVCPCRHRGTVV